MKKEDSKNEEMEVKVENKVKSKVPIILTMIIILVIGVILISVLTSKEGKTKNIVKSSLDKVVEKSDLETVSFTYNVIAKNVKKKKNVI
ncbi:MAG: hypothetical protein PUC82_02550 [bacterium]|nr:hypothetical protein [bacterium]